MNSSAAYLMSKILLVQNITREEAGFLKRILNEHGLQYEQVDLSKGQQYPDPRNYSVVIVFGGPDSANDGTEKMKMELRRNREAVDAGIR